MRLFLYKDFSPILSSPAGLANVGQGDSTSRGQYFQSAAWVEIVPSEPIEILVAVVGIVIDGSSNRPSELTIAPVLLS